MTEVYGRTDLPVWDHRIKLRCVGIRDETADVKSFIWQPAAPARFVYCPGQFIALNLTIDGSRPGPYSPVTEGYVQNFTDWYTKQLRAHIEE